MSSAMFSGPVAGEDRFVAIDALRGFALFGILLANLPYWGGFPFASAEQQKALMGGVSPSAFGIFFNGILDGKFYTLFSLMFGLGFALQLERLEKRGADGLAIFRRRMAALLLIGCVHLFLIWDGDILVLYALLGFVLPLFRHESDRALAIWALGLVFVLPMAAIATQHATGINPGAPVMALAISIAETFGISENTDLLAYGTTGGWQHWLGWQSNGWAFSLADRLENWRFAKVLGCMVAGMLAGRFLMRGALLENRRLLWRVLVAGLLIGLPAMVAYVQMPPHSQATWPSLIGTAPLGLAYGAAFLLAWPRAQGVLGVFAPVGRMALTNYLTHSLVGGFVAFGWGLGLMGKLDLDALYIWGIALYAAQVVLSHLWLRRFRQGPVEALWRRMTYGRRAVREAVPA